MKAIIDWIRREPVLFGRALIIITGMLVKFGVIPATASDDIILLIGVLFLYERQLVSPGPKVAELQAGLDVAADLLNTDRAQLVELGKEKEAK